MNIAIIDIDNDFETLLYSILEGYFDNDSEDYLNKATDTILQIIKSDLLPNIILKVTKAQKNNHL